MDLPRLSTVAHRRLVITCPKCGRRGRYAVARLIEKHGDVTLIWLRERLSADSPRLIHPH